MDKGKNEVPMLGTGRVFKASDEEVDKMLANVGAFGSGFLLVQRDSEGNLVHRSVDPRDVLREDLTPKGTRRCVAWAERRKKRGAVPGRCRAAAEHGFNTCRVHRNTPCVKCRTGEGVDLRPGAINKLCPRHQR